MVRRVVAPSLAALLAFLPVAAAADTASDARMAETLFTEGRRLIGAGKYEEACPKLAESQRLDPAPGTALNLGTCYEHTGKTASAWFAFRDAEASAVAAGQKDRVAAARKKAAQLEPTLSRLTIVVAPESRAPGLEVRADGAVVAQGGWGTALPVDPGPHDVVATAPGRSSWSTHVEVGAKAAQFSVTIPKLEVEPPITPTSAAPSSGATQAGTATVTAQPTAPVASERDTAPNPGRAQRVIGLTVGALGVVALGAGAYFGLKARSTYNEALDACGGTTVCTTDRGLQLRSDVNPLTTASTVAVIAGAGMAIGGVALFFTAPRKTTADIAVGVIPATGGAQLSMRGLW